MNHHPVSLFINTWSILLIYISMSLFPHPDYFEGNSTFVSPTTVSINLSKKKEDWFLVYLYAYSYKMLLVRNVFMYLLVLIWALIIIFFLYQGLVWLKDKEATHCKLCEKEFSLSKRKVRENRKWVQKFWCKYG